MRINMKLKIGLFENLWNSSDLANYLKISKSQVDKLRAYSPSDLPPHIKIGHSVRYCPDTVKLWISDKVVETNPLDNRGQL